MDIRLLGQVEVAENDHVFSLGGPKQRTVLVHLVLRPNQVVTSDFLIDQIWGDDPPAAVRTTLQGYISHLRKALGPECLEGRSGGYVLRVDREAIDTFRFERLVAEGQALVRSDPAAAALVLGEALALWRGRALHDLERQDSLQPEIARLEELRMVALEERISADLQMGRNSELVPELEALVGAHPLRERLWVHLMSALYRAGRQGDALAAYHRARSVLASELGIDPSPELRRLHERVLRQDPALEVAGEPLRGYRLLEQVGAGAFGSVHRAFQPQVGREVAVKAIHERFANQVEFIRRFEAEAQLVARLEHPHIVPLYDFWREPAGAYLVMRYLRGGSLRDVLLRGPLSTGRVAEMLDQLAPALETAHRHGVVHRDVKPANILFDEDGNAFLSDFGIAKDLASTRAGSPGPSSRPSGYYLSPEEVKGEPTSPRTDIYTLGLAVFEALTGRHPFGETPADRVAERHLDDAVPSPSSIRSDLPIGLDEVISRATAKNPRDRYPDTCAFAADFREVLDPGVTVRSVTVVRPPNPYKGLRPFQEADAGDFFGRDALVDRLLGRLRQDSDGARFLAVVGPSGSGKSSLVRAGLVPVLRNGVLPGSDRWFCLEMKPGAHPFDELAAVLMRIAVDPPPDLAHRLGLGGDAIVNAVNEVLPPGAELLLVIDQFEEVFTLVDDEQLRARFLSSLVVAMKHPSSRLRVVATLRADFYDRPLAYRDCGDLVLARTEGVGPLSVEELEQAVVGPAERVGVRVDPPVVTEIVTAVTTQPGALPLLQYALTELFDRREGSTLTVEAYRAIGGVAGALAQRAEDLYERLNDSGKQAARHLFLRLVNPGHPGEAHTRRRVWRSELDSLEVDFEAMNTVIGALGAQRLVSFDRDRATRAPTVEVAHEALLSEWARLSAWIESAREDVEVGRRLSAATGEWLEADRDASFLLRGDNLGRFESWAGRGGIVLTEREREYLNASLAQRDAEQDQEQARSARERRLERRSKTTLRALVGVFAVLAIVASVLTILTFVQSNRAKREARVAAARELAAAAVANLDQDPERSLLLALEAVNTTRRSDGFVVREAEEALHRAAQLSRVLVSVPQGGSGLAVTPDGRRFATSGTDEADRSVVIWDTETGREVDVLTGPNEGELELAFSPDGEILATSHDDGTVRLWNTMSGAEVRVLRGHEGFVTQAAFSPDGRWLAAGGQDHKVLIWDLEGRQPVRVLTGHDYEIWGVAFSPDGSQLASAGADFVGKVWDLRKNAEPVDLTGHEWPLTDIVFGPDGRHLATSSNDGTVRLWEAGSGQGIRTIAAPVSLQALDLSSDGSRVAAIGADAVARVWDTETGREVLTLPGHVGLGGNIAFASNGDRLITSALDGTTRVWDVSVAGGRDLLTVPGANRIYLGVAFSPDGSMFAAPAEPSGVSLWDTDTGDELMQLRGHRAKLTTVAFSPDGKRLAAGSDLTLSPPVWDLDTGELMFKLLGHTEPARSVAFSSDGHRLVTGSFDGTARVWDANSGEQLAVLKVGVGVVDSDFSPDGRFVVTGDDAGRVTVWDASTFKKERELLGHTAGVTGLAFGRGDMFVSSSDDGTARVWDFQSGTERVVFRGHNAVVNQVALSPDGTNIASASDDGTTKLWGAATGEELLTLHGHDDLVFGVAFHPTERILATASADGTIDLHLLSLNPFLELALDRVTRALTDEECRRFLHVASCPKP